MAKSKPRRPPPCSLEFYRVAVQRFDEAKFLLDEGRFTTASVYLAGYAVECALKAVLLANTPRKKHQEVKGSFRGKIAHNFDWLQNQLVKRGVVIPDEVLRHLLSVSWWGTDLRYEPGALERRRAIRFLTSVEQIVEWANRSI